MTGASLRADSTRFLPIGSRGHLAICGTLTQVFVQQCSGNSKILRKAGGLQSGDQKPDDASAIFDLQS